MRINTFLNNASGQSVLEFFLFLPLLLVLFIITVTISASINGSINQLKSTRGYFYFLTKSNPKLPSREDLAFLSASGGIEVVGMNTLGWMDYQEGINAVAPCYDLSKLVSSEKAKDTCLDSSSIGGKGSKSRFIRAYTVYGVCSAFVFSLNKTSDKVGFRDVSSIAFHSGYCRRK